MLLDAGPDLVAAVQSAAAAAGWTIWETEDGRVGARRPQHELDYIHGLANPDAAQKIYLYAARVMIALNEGEQALADVRAVLADSGVVNIDGADDAYLAEAIWRQERWWDEPTPKAHPKFGPRSTSPYARLCRAFRRERWKRRMDGLLPRLAHGDAAVIAMNKIAVAHRSPIRVDWQAVARSLDARTATELEHYLAGATVEEMGLKNYLHFQRRWSRLGGLILRHHLPEH
jgi:hypothetical protein